MKIRRQAAASALVASAYAQGQYASSSSTSPPASSQASVTTAPPSTSYTTITYSDCPSSSMETMITVTSNMTLTICPECAMASSSVPGHTTVYTTVYQSLCPTGVVPATYMVTESCSEPTPTWTPGPSHIPQGFTVETMHCSVCETPGPVTITKPCGCEANEGVPVSTPAATTAPASGGSPGGSPPAQTTLASSGTMPPNAGGSAVCEYVDGQPQAGCSSPNPPASGSGSPAPGTGSYAGGSPPASGGDSPAPPAAGGSTAPYPTASTTKAVPCSGAACRGNANPGTTTGIEQSTNAAAITGSFGFVSSAIMAVIVSALAFML
ncbi:hypothetical protein LTR53_008412 [Teratosphaeriaceae sp. CCFEE 6253]|nr:hypothetical protein LTR53_008412 [Teratosphaeriaceae sp. CCFEE 6253]